MRHRTEGQAVARNEREGHALRLKRGKPFLQRRFGSVIIVGLRLVVFVRDSRTQLFIGVIGNDAEQRRRFADQLLRKDRQRPVDQGTQRGF